VEDFYAPSETLPLSRREGHGSYSPSAKGEAEGVLTPISADLDQNLFGGPEMAAVRSHFFPYYLDAASSFRAGGYWGIGIGIVASSHG